MFSLMGCTNGAMDVSSEKSTAETQSSGHSFIFKVDIKEPGEYIFPISGEKDIYIIWGDGTGTHYNSNSTVAHNYKSSGEVFCRQA